MSEAVKTRGKLIQGESGPWEVVIGLEVHAQVLSKAKLFSGASTEFGGAPNSHVSLVDAGMPGMLPVINDFCVEQAVRTGLGLQAQINKVSVFDRKNYFYADLPQGYQISQYKQPIVGEGEVHVDLPAGESVTVRIERLHLEQDAGKSLHDQDPHFTFVDLNRSGVALMEIVSKPDMRSADEAAAYLKKLREILRYLGTCDGNMDEGSMRADVNVSVCRVGGYEKFIETGSFEYLGTRCEIKNVNSMRFVAQAIEYESRRQVEVLESGRAIDQETRLFDNKSGVTRPMRSKEEAHDYRYFPDPDLLPLELDDAFIERIRLSLPELPDAKKARFVSQYGLSPYDATVLTAERETAEFYESVAKDRDAKAAANWVTGDFFASLNRDNKAIAESPVSAAALGELIDLIADGTISGKIAKDVFVIMYETSGMPRAIVEERGLRQVTDTGAIAKAIDDVIDSNPQKVEELLKKPKLIGWFVGEVMKRTQGKANPQAVNELLRAKLGDRIGS
ncbi:MAG: Asp-tRNA(Asn)/Glu-tRNA(Gln) amidotransferase subunit GatB [Alphaproteobacteria bacterium]|nr:Asp-tRNA(Asn)/Glu-tRNA(Gln) amidotransferase subunit GatB [Alphaproteobacteria bacterium]